MSLFGKFFADRKIGAKIEARTDVLGQACAVLELRSLRGRMRKWDAKSRAESGELVLGRGRQRDPSRGGILFQRSPATARQPRLPSPGSKVSLHPLRHVLAEEIMIRESVRPQHP